MFPSGNWLVVFKSGRTSVRSHASYKDMEWQCRAGKKKVAVPNGQQLLVLTATAESLRYYAELRRPYMQRETKRILIYMLRTASW